MLSVTPGPLTTRKNVCRNIHELCYHTAIEYGTPGNYVNGANIAGFIRVANAMVALGVV